LKFAGKKINLLYIIISKQNVSFVISGLFRCSIKYLQAKSLYRSRAGSHFYGTENEIWADFGPVGKTKSLYFLK
jgi:hypothetical protein